MATNLGLELTRDHRLRQIRNAAAVAAMVVELCNRHRKGLYTDAELITALVGAEALGFESAVAMASEYMVEHRTLVARDLLDAPLVVPEFDAKAASARALSTLKAFHRLRAAELPQHVVDREFRAITGNLGVWANKATHMASRNLVVESAGYAGSRWRRVTDGNPCAFCAMLAARGPVYLTRESAGHVVGREMGRGTKHYRSTGKVSYGGPADRRRGTRDIGERYHDRCGCTVEEVTGDWSPTAEEQRFVNLYRDALERLQDQDQPASTTNILGAMREMGDGVIHDAHTPETKTGSGAGGGRNTTPPFRSGAQGDGSRWAQVSGRPPSGEGGTVHVPSGVRIADHELTTARRLAAYGADVQFRIPVYGYKLTNPDAFVDGELWEFKSPTGSSVKNTISDQFKRAGRQADSLVLDLARCGLDEDEAIQQAIRRFLGPTRIRQLIILDRSGTVAYYGRID